MSSYISFCHLPPSKQNNKHTCLNERRITARVKMSHQKNKLKTEACMKWSSLDSFFLVACNDPQNLHFWKKERKNVRLSQRTKSRVPFCNSTDDVILIYNVTSSLKYGAQNGGQGALWLAIPKTMQTIKN